MQVWQWVLCGGVDPQIAGNGGASCAEFLSNTRRIVETLLIGLWAMAVVMWACCKISLPADSAASRTHLPPFRRCLLALMCLTFACEIGFKLATGTFIYLLNPCHVVTVAQIYLLAAPPSRLVAAVFRWQMHSLNGALLALAFPILNTRLLPFEMELYFVQHVAMLVIPFYLLQLGGVYTMEDFADFSWAAFSLGTWLVYHFVPLQFIGLFTQVNLNNMLCPAVSDPFHGPNYRVWATGHQSLLIGLLGKAYGAASTLLIRTCRVENRESLKSEFKNDNGHCSGQTNTANCNGPHED